MNIKLYIERLVLDGISVSHADRPHLQAAIEVELGKLLSVGGVNSGLQAGTALPSIRTGDIHLAADSSPNELGQRIAGALYGVIGK